MAPPLRGLAPGALPALEPRVADACDAFVRANGLRPSEARVLHLACAGVPRAALAGVCGVSESTIHRTIATGLRRWDGAAPRSLDAMVIAVLRGALALEPPQALEVECPRCGHVTRYARASAA